MARISEIKFRINLYNQPYVRIAQDNRKTIVPCALSHNVVITLTLCRSHNHGIIPKYYFI